MQKKLFFLLALYPIFFQAQISEDDFVTIWKTDNPGTILSDSEILISTTGDGYNYDIDWDNDGVFDEFGLTGDVQHDYRNPGTYTVRIRGNFPRFYLNDNNRNKRKIIGIGQWGKIEWTSMENAFLGAINLNISATDSPNLTNVSSMKNMFADARVMNANINNWDVSNVTDMSGLFNDAREFNSPLSNWDVSKVTDMSLMFRNCENFNQAIGNWDVSNVTNMSAMFNGAAQFNQPLDDWDVSNVINMSSMFVRCFLFNQEIGNWATSKVQNIAGLFAGATAFNQNINSWDVSNVTDMAFLFNGAISYDHPLDNWNTTNVTDMRAMFRNATSFNQNINGWDVSKVTDMRAMFQVDDVDDPFGLIPPDEEQSRFNHPLDSWDVSNVTTMSEMFYGATVFNQDIGSWNVSQVTDMQEMFYDAFLFNQPLNDWNVGNVTNMKGMFGSSPGPVFGGGPAMQFNQPLDQWDVSNVTDMSQMFIFSESFNSSLSNWDVRKVETMSAMFYGTEAFNQPLDSWEFGSTKSIFNMFGFSESFNQPLNGWDTSGIVDMGQAFYFSKKFNQPLNEWDVSSVTQMDAMFLRAESFNQDLSNWNIGNVTDMSRMITGSNLSLENYDNLLIAWAEKQVQTNVLFEAIGIKYCTAAQARDKLINDFGWTIVDDGEGCTTDSDNDGVLDINDNCPNTPQGVLVDFDGCPIFTLPPGNFSIKITDESCIGSNNGSIEVLAEESFDYTATLLLGNQDLVSNFSQNTLFENLTSGFYELCITVEDEEYEVCFELTLDAPPSITASSKVDTSSKTVTLSLSGGTTFYISLNDQVYQTTESKITLPLTKIQNSLKVYGKQPCQGVYEKNIVLSDLIYAYPNPVSLNQIEVFLGNTMEFESVEATIYSLDGRLLLNQKVSVQNGVAPVDLTSLNAGVYILDVKSKNTLYNQKIIKE